MVSSQHPVRIQHLSHVLLHLSAPFALSCAAPRKKPHPDADHDQYSVCEEIAPFSWTRMSVRFNLKPRFDPQPHGGGSQRDTNSNRDAQKQYANSHNGAFAAFYERHGTSDQLLGYTPCSGKGLVSSICGSTGFTAWICGKSRCPLRLGEVRLQIRV